MIAVSLAKVFLAGFVAGVAVAYRVAVLALNRGGGGAMTSPSRPALRYMGGKWRLAPRIIAHFPPHRLYLEPFGGAASVLLRKPRAYAEIYNDLDGEVVALFRVLRDEQLADRLIRAIALTPFARKEFDLSYQVADDPVENARRLIVRSFMGHGSTAIALRRRTGFRADSNRSHTTPSHDWMNLPPHLAAIVERLRGVVVECRPAISLIERFGNSRALIYCDPPYLQATRSQKRVHGALEHAYTHEMTDADHAELLGVLGRSPAMIVLSGYPSPLYDGALKGWARVEMSAMADGARPRREVLWINPAATAASGELLGLDAA